MKKILPVLALGILMLFAVGCSSDPKPATTTPPAKTAPSTNATKPTGAVAPMPSTTASAAAIPALPGK